jgi:hypothetical protein
MKGSDPRWRDVALLEGFGKETESIDGDETPTPPFRALRSEDILYAEYESGERELYDLRKDPYQISNIAPNVPNPVLREYSRRLKALGACKGSECAQYEDDPMPNRPTVVPAKSDPKKMSKSKGNRKAEGKSIQKSGQHREKRIQQR